MFYFKMAMVFWYHETYIKTPSCTHILHNAQRQMRLHLGHVSFKNRQNPQPRTTLQCRIVAETLLISCQYNSADSHNVTSNLCIGHCQLTDVQNATWVIAQFKSHYQNNNGRHCSLWYHFNSTLISLIFIVNQFLHCWK